MYKIYDVAPILEALKLMSKIVSDNHGNVSYRIKRDRTEGDLVYIKPSGMAYDEITLEDIVEVQMDGDFDVAFVPQPQRRPSVDLLNHLALYEKFPNVRAICHTHSPYVVAHAMANTPIRVYCTEHADTFGATIGCWPFEPDMDKWGEKIAPYNGCSTQAMLLENHGGVTLSEYGPIEAVKLAAQLENIAQKNFLARQLGTGLVPMKSEDIKRWHERYTKKYGQ